jgi:hypothetical protein
MGWGPPWGGGVEPSWPGAIRVSKCFKKVCQNRYYITTYIALMLDDWYIINARFIPSKNDCLWCSKLWSQLDVYAPPSLKLKIDILLGSITPES